MKYIFTNGHILDGTKDMKVLDGHSVLVEDDKITGIVKGNTDRKSTRLNSSHPK